MIIVEDIFVDDEVLKGSFCCDLQACRGACCCLEGGRGAPLEDAEVAELRKAYPAVRPYLRPVSIATIERDGLVEGFPGNFATTCIESKECAFVYFDEGIAKCGFERAYQEGKTTWPKPLSCHLFPIRVRRFGREVVRYEHMTECRPAVVLGETLHVKLYAFLKSPLIRKYGEDWYNLLTSKKDAA
jgi:hypothetical protein